jgi:outer membrane protein TolC
MQIQPSVPEPARPWGARRIIAEAVRARPLAASRLRRAVRVAAASLLATVVACAAAPALPRAAAAGGLWTLERVLAETRRQDPEIEAARRAGAAGRAAGAAAFSALSPRVTLDAGATRSDDPALLFSQKLWQGRFTEDDFALSSLNRPGPRSAWNWGVTVEQPLWNGGAEVTAPRLAAHHRRAATELERARTADRLLAVIGIYAGAVRSREALAADSIALGAAEAQRRAAVERFRLGQVPELDTLRAAARWAETRTTWLTARKDLSLALARLSQLVGADIAAEALAGLPDPAAIAPPGTPGRGRGELEASRADAGARGVEATRATFLLLPSVNARLDYRDYRDPVNGEGDRRFLAAVSVSLPVWDGLRRLEERRAARALAAEARARTELLRRDLEIEAADARAEASLSLERRDTARLARAASEEALRLALARYRAGLLSQTDLLAADSDAARARRSAVHAEVDAVVAQYRHQHAMGALE